MATNENIVTDRTTEGAKPANIPNNQSEHNMTINCNKEPFLLISAGAGAGFY